MALEKTKKDKVISPENIKKTKRNRRQTACSINRYKGCGICGSLNVAYQGVKFCNICGEEIEIITYDEWDWSGDPSHKVPCECVKEHKNFKGHISFYRDVNKHTIGVCMDCGAVKSRFCPNCNKNNYRLRSHNCWKSAVGNKKFCQSCGYRT